MLVPVLRRNEIPLLGCFCIQRSKFELAHKGLGSNFEIVERFLSNSAEIAAQKCSINIAADGISCLGAEGHAFRSAVHGPGD